MEATLCSARAPKAMRYERVAVCGGRRMRAASLRLRRGSSGLARFLHHHAAARFVAPRRVDQALAAPGNSTFNSTTSLWRRRSTRTRTSLLGTLAYLLTTRTNSRCSAGM